MPTTQAGVAGRHGRRPRTRLRGRIAGCGVLLGILVLPPSLLQAQRATLPDPAVLDSMSAAEYALDSVASITVGVIVQDSLVWTRSYGWADMERHIPATRQTVYRVGSITKPFTAVMLLQLLQRGTLSLADPVDRWLPQVHNISGLPAGASPPTLLQLATMNGGLAREPKQEGPFWTGPVSSWERTLFAALPHTVYDFAPGTKLQYSNIGYAILGAALEKASGVPYVTWERAHILDPLGMTHSRFEIDAGIADDVAKGYEVRRDGSIDDTTSQREARTGRGYKVPNGALFTTVDDLAHFVELELGYGPEAVLPKSVLDREFGGVVVSAADLGFGYGIGFMATRGPDGYVALGHTGSVAGFTAAMEYDRKVGVGVVVFRNAGGGKANAARLANALLRRLVAAQAPAGG
jgi:CubicO group peptidase (beta-lactamase class C family)